MFEETASLLDSLGPASLELPLTLVAELRDARIYRTVARIGAECQMVLVTVPQSNVTSSIVYESFAHQLRIEHRITASWGGRPLRLASLSGQTVLLSEDLGGTPLARVGQTEDKRQFLSLALPIARCLSECHDCGLLHRDINLLNVFVDPGRGAAWLANFANAALIGDRDSGFKHDLCSTLECMSPEHIGRMGSDLDVRSDLYSLGAVFYKMLTGCPPFATSNLQQWVHSHLASSPVAPENRAAHIDHALSSIVMKLLSKTPEDRYQTAVGLVHDLLEYQERIDGGRDERPFIPGLKDAFVRLRPVRRFHGKDANVIRLSTALDRVRAEVAPRLFLLHGHSGVGKSRTFDEFRRAHTGSATFASGKCDPQLQAVPYAPLKPVLRRMVDAALSLPVVRLDELRRDIEEAAGVHSHLLSAIVPEFASVIPGRREVSIAVENLSEQRVGDVLADVLTAFSRSFSTLVLFIDDLQWADSATLWLLGRVLRRRVANPVMVVGAYRDDERTEDVPVDVFLAEHVEYPHADRVEVSSLAACGVEDFIAEALSIAPTSCVELAKLIYAKTGGSPLFIEQYLKSLVDEGLLLYDVSEKTWSWDRKQLETMQSADDVEMLVKSRLEKMSTASLSLLAQLGCVGGEVDLNTICTVSDLPLGEVKPLLEAAVNDGVLLRSGPGYRFIHDKIREAAYSTIPVSDRPGRHRQIAIAILKAAEGRNIADVVFQIVGQYNHAIAEIDDEGERLEVYRLNFLAAKEAKRKYAYADAAKYLEVCTEILGERLWTMYRDLGVDLEVERARCDFMLGSVAQAEERLDIVFAQDGARWTDAAAICLRIEVNTAMGASDRAVMIALRYLESLGIVWSAHPSDEDVREEYQAMTRKIGTRSVDDVCRLPGMVDAAAVAAMEIVTRLQTPAMFTDLNLANLSICRAVNLSLEFGNCDASAFAYVMVGRLTGPRFGNYRQGFELGQAGFNLAKATPMGSYHASVFLVYVLLTMHWTRDVRDAQIVLRETFSVARKTGDLLYAAYTCNNLISNLIFCAAPLKDVEKEIGIALEFVRSVGFKLVEDILLTQCAVVRSMMGESKGVGVLDNEEFDEAVFEPYLLQSPSSAIAACWYWIRKMQCRYIGGDYEEAAKCVQKAKSLIWTSSLFLEEAEFHFFAALSLIACDRREKSEAVRDVLDEHLVALKTFSENCPANFRNRLLLVQAELFRHEGKISEAQLTYEEAISESCRNDLPNSEGLSCELAYRFYEQQGLHIAAASYKRRAREAYLRWGALGKVRQFDEVQWPMDRYVTVRSGGEGLGLQLAHLDLATLVEVSQSVSSEIDSNRLIEVLMTKAISHAGADRGVLVLLHKKTEIVRAEGLACDGEITITAMERPLDNAHVPRGALSAALAEGKSLVIEDARSDRRFESDNYLSAAGVRSALCFPIARGGKISGAIYLENKLLPGVFDGARCSVISVICAQVATALENARLYTDLKLRESKIRRLVDSNLVGLFIFGRDGTLLDSNSSFLDMLGYSRADVEFGRLNWAHMTGAVCVGSAVDPWELALGGSLERTFETEFLRSDGASIPVLAGISAFDEENGEAVAFVLDLTERKCAEEEARRADQRYQDARAELAHASRVTSLGQMAATISHEVKQPISAMAVHADAGLRWLTASPPNVIEAKNAFALISRDALRAGSIVDRIRGLVRKAPPEIQRIDLDDAINEIVAMTGANALKHNVSIELRLGTDARQISADRVQLQQVVLNLVVNAIEALSSTNESHHREIVIESRRENGMITVSVSDTGPGIGVGDFERLFEPFFTTKKTGMGIGLAVSRDIVEGYGGTLTAVRNERGGTSFTIALPEN
ncbi:ATP-binding sensor histidine kinase [Paraburkholderia caribensis]|uniref:ATP-binding sensor histidine kinase n=1 Tax=Paraburkholderia caribensis TaxID=75105 RepID=UPI001591BCCC|nr:ATP-binding protein [Paraburkholderia caribensis]